MAISQWSEKSRSLRKPELGFEDKIDNYRPFIPKIERKPNALPDNPLPKVLVEYNSRRQDAKRSWIPKDKSIFDHPYEKELDALEFTKEQLKGVTPKHFLPLPESPCEVISKKEDLASLVAKLKECTEIAIDLECYSYRSFQGFTCLVQISTREDDFLIDAIELRSEIYQLNEIFTDPKIVKVFHGAAEDIKWLQRDFGVYVVNMFDTALATREMGHRKSSLDYVLHELCGIKSSGKRKMQLADWRVRPLPDEMVKYAREDTHYLLYIYDILKNKLIETDRSDPETEESNLVYVLEESLVMCYQRYRLSKSKSFKKRKHVDKNERTLLRLLCQWRDKTARAEDESLGYVIPNAMLLDIVTSMPQDLLDFFTEQELKNHPLIKKHAKTIQGIVKQIKASPKPTPGSEKSSNVTENKVDEESTTLNGDLEDKAEKSMDDARSAGDAIRPHNVSPEENRIDERDDGPHSPEDGNNHPENAAQSPNLDEKDRSPKSGTHLMEGDNACVENSSPTEVMESEEQKSTNEKSHSADENQKPVE